MQLLSHKKQTGVSLTGLIMVLAILGLIAVLAMKVIPTFTEYQSVKKAIASAKAAGNSVSEIRTSFDKQAEVGYIDAINGKDLEIVKNGEGFDVSFAYQKKIPLFGPASLLMEYEGSTAPKTLTKKPVQ